MRHHSFRSPVFALASSLVAAPVCLAEDAVTEFIAPPRLALLMEEKAVAAPEPAPAPDIVHFLMDVTAKTHYLTPRGLVVENEGSSIQVLTLVIVDVYQGKPEDVVNRVSVVGGMWNNFLDTAPGGQAWNEIDPIISVEVQMWKNWIFSITYVPFVSPPDLFDTEHNLEFKIAYDDTDLLGDFALHPYVKPFWNFSGDSVVVLGDTPSWDFEIGIAPSFTFMKDTSLPVTVTFPIFMTLGDSKFFGGGEGGIGTYSAGIEVSIPLTFIPKEWGFWKLHAGVQYFHIENESLQTAGNILSGTENQDQYVGSLGVTIFLP